MNAFKSLLDDGKGLIGLGLIIAATVLTALGNMTIDQWQTFATWIFGIYAGSTALHGGLVALGNRAPAALAVVAPAPAPAATAPTVAK